MPAYYLILSFFRLSFIPMVVSPIMIPMEMVSFFGGGVVLLTFVSVSEPVEPSLLLLHDTRTPATIIVKRIPFI
jgi:hypothetical protein